MQWRIIDGIGPFFRGLHGHRINWSKIPFASIERDGKVPAEAMQAIGEEFRVFVAKAAALGCNAVTLDDCAHLVPVPEYDDALRTKIDQYRAWYRTLFAHARAAGLSVFITTDIMFYNDVLHRRLGRRIDRVAAFLHDALDQLFADFPEIAGIITRIGESDGVDVRGDFHSELTVRTPRQARRLLHALLPVFGKHQRTWIFRTWSIGAYPIGDLMWNRTTCARTFDGIDHPALIVSHKYGESDFFRYLPLNKQFFRGSYRKLIELQARREYEGFGEYPSFIGWDYESYAQIVRARPDLAGFSVWCQTGGWSGFHRRTFLHPTSCWNELNAYVTVHVFQHGESVETAVKAFLAEHYPHIPAARFLTFLRLSDEVIKELLYIDEFSQRKLFFRRLRVPPLLWVFWDHIVINHSMRKMLRCFVADGEAKVLQGRLALMKIREMMAMAREWGLPEKDLQFQYDTFEILAAAREYYFRPFNDDIVLKLKGLTRRYRRKYPSRYAILLSFAPVSWNRRRVRRLFGLLLRDKRGYRMLDHLVTIRLLSMIFPAVRRFSRHRIPEFAERQAMGWETVLR